MNNNQINKSIVYKKTSDYENDSTISNSSVDLDESVISIDNMTDSNYNLNNLNKCTIKNNKEIHKNNINLINDINKELINDLNPAKFNHDTNKNTENVENMKNIENTENIDDKCIDDFIYFFKTHCIEFNDINKINNFEEIIKSYITEKNLNQENISIFLHSIYKNKTSLKNKLNSIKKNFVTNKNTNDDIDIVTNDTHNELNATNEYNELDATNEYNELNATNEYNELNFIDKLIKNDINTWIFIGIILISFIIIIMVMINKK